MLDRVSGRGVQAAIKLGMRRLELLPNLGLGPPCDFAPEPLPVRPEADRDRTNVAVFAASK